MDASLVGQWTKDMLEFVQSAPWWQAALLLYFAAMIEYVFPPFPGDTVFIAGGFFAMHGVIRVDVTFAALLLGTWSGTILAWWIGKYSIENPKFRALVLKYVSSEQIQRLINLYAKYGNWLLFFNRFIPGIRGTFVIGSGIVQMPLKRVMLWSTASALLWNTLLILIGAWFAHNLDTMLAFFDTYARIIYVALALAAVFYLGRKVWNRYF